MKRTKVCMWLHSMYLKYIVYFLFQRKQRHLAWIKFQVYQHHTVNSPQYQTLWSLQPSMLVVILTKSALQDSLVLFIAWDLMPLFIVDSQQFSALTGELEPRYQMPSRKTLSSKLLHNKATSVHADLKNTYSRPRVCLWPLTSGQIVRWLDILGSQDTSSWTGHYKLLWLHASVSRDDTLQNTYVRSMRKH